MTATKARTSKRRTLPESPEKIAARAAMTHLGIQPSPAAPLTRRQAVAFIDLAFGIKLHPKVFLRWLTAGKVRGAYLWQGRWRIPPEALVAWANTHGRGAA